MEELRLAIINLMNNSGLSLEAEMFVIRDIYRDVQETIRAYNEQQKAQYSQDTEEVETEIVEETPSEE